MTAGALREWLWVTGSVFGLVFRNASGNPVGVHEVRHRLACGCGCPIVADSRQFHCDEVLCCICIQVPIGEQADVRVVLAKLSKECVDDVV